MSTDQENMLPQFLDSMRDKAEGTPADIQEPTDDSAFEKRSRELVTLYRYAPLMHPVSNNSSWPHPHRVSDASGSLEVTPVGKYPLKREMLDTKVGVGVTTICNSWQMNTISAVIHVDFQDAFIVDAGPGGIYGWVGKGATQQEKKAAYQSALVGYYVSSRWQLTTRLVHFAGFYCPEGLPNVDPRDVHT